MRESLNTLRWFGHVERMDDSWLVKRMYSVEYAGNRPAGGDRGKSGMSQQRDS